MGSSQAFNARHAQECQQADQGGSWASATRLMSPGIDPPVTSALRGGRAREFPDSRFLRARNSAVYDHRASATRAIEWEELLYWTYWHRRIATPTSPQDVGQRSSE